MPVPFSRSPTYDYNGNLTDTGNGQTYTWDAKNQLTKITYTGGATTEMSYDGMGRRTKIVEKNSSSTVTSTKQFVWIGNTMAEERDASNAVTKRFFAQGEQISGTSYFYTRDHLGSVREMTDSSGTIQARYDYDPYGQMTKVSGSLDSDFQYGHYYEHATSGVNLTKYRAYDSNVGRWLSRDPIAELGGINLHGYVLNNPINRQDTLGLWNLTISAGAGLGGTLSFGVDGGHFNMHLGLGEAAGFKVTYDKCDNPTRNNFRVGLYAAGAVTEIYDTNVQEADVFLGIEGSMGNEDPSGLNLDVSLMTGTFAVQPGGEVSTNIVPDFGESSVTNSTTVGGGEFEGAGGYAGGMMW